MDCDTFKTWLVATHADHDPRRQDAFTHLAECHGCRRLWQKDTILENEMRQCFTATEAPPNLTARLRSNIEKSSSAQRRHSFAPSWRWLAPMAAVTAAIVLIVFTPLSNQLSTMDKLGSYALANHLAPIQPLGITSSKTDLVGQWFSGKMPFALSIPDLSQRGYVLQGGRPCTLGKKKAVYLSYDHQGQRISVFVISSDRVGFALLDGRKYQIREGRHLIEVWEEKDMMCVIVRAASPLTTTGI